MSCSFAILLCLKLEYPQSALQEAPKPPANVPDPDAPEEAEKTDVKGGFWLNTFFWD